MKITEEYLEKCRERSDNLRRHDSNPGAQRVGWMILDLLEHIEELEKEKSDKAAADYARMNDEKPL